MNYPALALSLAFVAIGLPFLAKAKKETDPLQQRNKRLAGILFLVAAAAFLVAFVLSVFSSWGAR